MTLAPIEGKCGTLERIATELKRLEQEAEDVGGIPSLSLRTSGRRSLRAKSEG